MNPDTTDIILIFAFVVCVIILGGVSALRSAYRAGCMHGIMWEKRRRRKLEERVEQKIAETFSSPEWERELDV
jgi:hypothetical protein